MNENCFRVEAITSFLDENKNKFYLLKKWDDTSNENFLKLTLTDLTNFWSETCRIIL